MCIPKFNFDSCLLLAHKNIISQGMKSIWFYLHGHVGLTSRVFTVLIVEDGSVANKWFLVLLLEKIVYFLEWRGSGIHISLAAILDTYH